MNDRTCFAHPGELAVARVFMHGYECNAHYLWVCCESASLYRRHGHRVENV